jgi:S1-C subfamily serine protease
MTLIPPTYIDAVVAIGFDNAEGVRHYVATGFLYGVFDKAVGQDSLYRVYLVTNKHVLDGKQRAWLRFNPEGDDPAKEFPLDLFHASGDRLWFVHNDSTVDLAVISINANFLADQGIKYHIFRSNQNVATCVKAAELGISEGDGIFVLGFPMGLVGEHRNFVMVRGGIIARISDALCGRSKEFLIDATVFPGNSGGPVVTRPELVAITGTKANSTSYLLGVVKSYVPYHDVAISAQTNRPRIIFEENSGLAAVVPADFVVELVDLADETLRARQEAPLVTVDTATGEPEPSKNTTI